MTAINLRKSYLEEGMVAFDLSIDAPPPNFLGLATDIVFEGDFAAAGYRGMEWGDAIDRLPETLRPIQMVKALPDQSRVILGLTFRADRLPEMSGGVLARLIFEKDLLTPLSLEERVLSVYDGARKDLSSVEWTIAAAQPAATHWSPSVSGGAVVGGSESVFPAPDNVVHVSVGDDPAFSSLSSGHTLESNWQEMALLDALNAQPGEQQLGVLSWFLWPWIGAVVALALVAWYFRRGGRRTEAGNRRFGLTNS